MKLRQIIGVLVLLIIIFLFMWGFNTNKKKLAIVDSFQLVQEQLSKENRSYDYTKDWVDLVFTVTEKHLYDSNPWVKAEGILNGKKVGFIVEIVPNSIILKSVGDLSDNLVQEYVKLFENKESSKKMVENISFASIALEGDSSQISKKPIKYKLFFDKKFENPDSAEAKQFYEENYFEYYINFDLPNNLVYLMEKDTSYRKRFLKAFLE